MNRAKRVPPSSDPKITKAEKKAQQILRDYFWQHRSEQKRIAQETGIKQPFLSRLANKEGQTIALETAMLIEIATNGELRAEALCPARAEVIKKFLNSRATTSA